MGLTGGSSVSAGTIPISFWRASVCSLIASYPMSNFPAYRSIQSRGAWCGAWAAPGA